MKRTPTLLLWLAVAALSACTSQAQQTADTQSTPPAADTDSKPAPEKPDVDPYFRESSGISSNTGPQVITRNILQDSKGGFWLATWNGLMRYDGTTFTNVTNEEGLRRYRAFCLLEDHQENIWLGTIGAGVYRYDGSTYTNFTTEDGLVDNSMVSMMQDSDNNIWFGAMGVTKYDGTTFTSFTKEDGFTSGGALKGEGPKPGTSVLNRFDPAAGLENILAAREQFEVKAGRGIFGLTEDKDGNIWFGTGRGIGRIDGDTVRYY